MKQELLFELLNRALTEELGLVLTTNNPHQLSLKLHEIKKSSSRFAEIEVTIPSTPDTIMLVKKTVSLDEPGDLPDA